MSPFALEIIDEIRLFYGRIFFEALPELKGVIFLRYSG